MGIVAVNKMECTISCAWALQLYWSVCCNSTYSFQVTKNCFQTLNFHCTIPQSYECVNGFDCLHLLIILCCFCNQSMYCRGLKHANCMRHTNLIYAPLTLICNYNRMWPSTVSEILIWMWRNENIFLHRL